MPGRKWTWWTISLAAFIGTIGGLWATPSLYAHAVIRDLTSSKADTRMAAWEWLTSPPPGSETDRLYHWQPVVEDQLLAHGDDAALLDAVAVLEAHGCFGWEQSQPALMQRVIAALSRAGGDHAIAAAILRSNRKALPQLPSTGDKGTIHP